MKQTIAVDIDDVLSPSAEAFIAYSNKVWGHDLAVDDYHEEWGGVWGVPLEEAIRRSKLFHESTAYFEAFTCFDHALPVLIKLSKRYKLVILTSRKAVLKEVTEAWLNKHFPDVFSEVIFAGIWDGDEHVYTQLHKSKADMCRQVGADYLIDDQIKHCLGASEVGVTGLLFGSYGWNKTDKALPAGVVRVHNWKEVEEYFNA